MKNSEPGYALSDAVYDELNTGYGKSKRVTLSNGTQFEIKLLPDHEGDLDFYGKLKYSDKRPAEFDGAARKVTTRRDILWWQPPDDVKGNPEQTKTMFDRIQSYFYEEWSFVSLHMIEYSAPCTCCGEQKIVREEYLGGIESDISEDGLMNIINDFLPET